MTNAVTTMARASTDEQEPGDPAALLRRGGRSTGTSAVITRVPPAGVTTRTPWALARAARSSNASGSADDGSATAHVPAAGAGCHTGSMSSSSSAAGGSAPSRTSTTITETLSRPPWRLAAATSSSAAACGSVDRRQDLVDLVVVDLVGRARRSRATKRSPRTIGSVQASTRTDGSMPSARVMMLRRGWVRASSSVMWPALTSSWT